jgi:hypothetical protein
LPSKSVSNGSSLTVRGFFVVEELQYSYTPSPVANCFFIKC